MKFYVYRYMLDDNWIYVGKTTQNVVNRIRSHAQETKFAQYPEAEISYCVFDSKQDMDITEVALIKAMKPILNVSDITVSNMPFTFDPSSVQWTSLGKTKEYFPKTGSGAGRPIAGDYKMSKFIKIRAEPSFYKMVSDYANKLGISQSAFIRDSIMEKISRIDEHYFV